jgi:hypothetical protein
MNSLLAQLNPLLLKAKAEADGKLTVTGLYDLKLGEAGLELQERK